MRQRACAMSDGKNGAKSSEASSVSKEFLTTSYELIHADCTLWNRLRSSAKQLAMAAALASWKFDLPSSDLATLKNNPLPHFLLKNLKKSREREQRTSTGFTLSLPINAFLRHIQCTCYYNQDFTKGTRCSCKVSNPSNRYCTVSKINII